MAGKSKGKSIEITVKSTQLPSVDAKDDPKLLNSVVTLGKILSAEMEEASLKTKVETIYDKQGFLNTVKNRFDEEGIEDVTVTINSKLVIQPGGK